jgi:hypothetical protein
MTTSVGTGKAEVVIQSNLEYAMVGARRCGWTCARRWVPAQAADTPVSPSRCLGGRRQADGAAERLMPIVTNGFAVASANDGLTDRSSLGSRLGRGQSASFEKGDLMGQQSARQAARRSALDAQAARRK